MRRDGSRRRVLAADEAGDSRPDSSFPGPPSPVRRAVRIPPSVQIHPYAANQEFTYVSLTDYEWLSTGQIVSLRDRSYAHGPSDLPLLGETIGEHLRRTVERFGEREALVRSAIRPTAPPTTSSGSRSRRPLAPSSRTASTRVTALASGRQSLRMDRDAVRRGTHWRDPGPDRPDAQAGRARLHPHQGGREPAVMARDFRAADFPGHARRRPLELPLAARDDRPGARLEGVPGRCRVRDDGELAEPRGEPPVRRRDRRSSSPPARRASQGRDALPSQHPQQRVLHRAAARLSEDDRVCVPVPFSHWFGNVVGTLASATHGACVVVPGESFGPARCSRPCRRSAAPRSTACRRCSSPSSSSPIWAASISPACAPA